MSRQLRTVIVGAVLCVVLGVLSFVVPVPYVVLGPGPTVNTLGQSSGTDIISVSGHPVRATTGNLNLTTVSVDTSDTTVAGAVKAWLAGDESVVPHDSIYPPGQSQQQVNQQDAQDFTQSQDSATAAAACELGYPSGFGVLSVASNSTNTGVLKPGDLFVSVAGKATTDYNSLRAALQTLTQGATTPVVVKRDGQPVTLTAKLGAPAKGSTVPTLGVAVATGCLLPFQVTLSLAGIGGPSAGLMFTLGIIDKIGTTDLTHGKFIAGTGTIDATGAVGAIGGIQLKMIAARRAGATVFLAPTADCSEVRGHIPSGLKVVSVSTLKGALAALAALPSGGTSLPSC